MGRRVALLLACAAATSATNVTLPPSSPGTLRVLHADGWPVARSYDGHGWERTQGGATLHLACDAGVACAVTVPASSVYNITLHEAPAVDALQKASRFLVQATFGPTRATLQSLDATTDAGVAKWIDAQIALPPTLHREYYRRRANPRQFTARPTGGLRAACEAGSRWHRFAFSRAAEGKMLQVVSTPSGGAALSIDGELRTEADAGAVAFDGMIICAVEERVGGSIHMLSTIGEDLADTLTRCGKSSELAGAAILDNPQVGEYVSAQGTCTPCTHRVTHRAHYLLTSITSRSSSRRPVR